MQTIENTFGIPISHYIVINFFGVEDAVNALGGISLDFPYPARDQDCSTGTCYNNSGLNIPTAGCQVLDGAQALSLSRSRYFQYYADGYWQSDPTSDLGRIERQNVVISAALDKAKSTYNPLRLNSLLSSVVHDFTKDNDLTAGDLFALAERYHAFGGSSLNSYVLPTTGRGVVLRRRRRGRPARRGGRHDHPVPRRTVRADHHPTDRRLRQPVDPHGSAADARDRPGGRTHPFDRAGQTGPHRLHVDTVVRPDALLIPTSTAELSDDGSDGPQRTDDPGGAEEGHGRGRREPSLDDDELHRHR